MPPEVCENMSGLLKTSSGNWYVQYRVPGRNSPVKEYFGKGPEGQQAAKVRAAEIKLMKAKGVDLRDKSQMYLDHLAQLYLSDARTRGKSARWRKELANLLNQHMLPALCHRPVDQLGYEDVLRLAETWKTQSPATVNRYLGYLRAVFRFGVEQGFATKNPMAKWRKRKEQRRDVHLTVVDLRRFLENAEPHLAWAIEVEWELGTRPGVSELFALRWADVDFEASIVHVRGTKTASSDRLIPVTPSFRSRLLVMRQQAKSDFLIEYNGKPIKQLRRSVGTALKRAGISYGVRMYDIRHLFASVMLSGGADLAAVSALLGHSDITTTQRHYYHLLQGEKERAVAIRPTIHDVRAGKVVHIR